MSALPPIAESPHLLDPPVLNERGGLWPGILGKEVRSPQQMRRHVLLARQRAERPPPNFQTRPELFGCFGFGFGKKLSGLRATIIRRRHSRRHVVLRIILVQCSVALNRSGKISKQATANFKLGPRGVKIGQHHSRCVNIIPPPHHTAAPGFWAGFDFGKQAPVAAHNNCFAREPAARNF